MALTDTFFKNVKPARAAGDKHADGVGMYLLVTDGQVLAPRLQVSRQT
jgi:hypothetical protein